jgi:hypothetical protein
MPNRSSKRPSDPSQLAKLMVDIATGEVSDAFVDPIKGKNAAAVALGRLGGLKGGVARAARLTSEQKSEMAKKAAQVRWASRVEK